MGNYLILKNDGRYAYWSTVEDDFLFHDITLDDLIKYRTQQEIERIKSDIIYLADKLQQGEYPYSIDIGTYDELVKHVEEKE